jgi:talin
MYYNDGTWSEGLVSAAKHVATSTQDLCEAANKVSRGENRDLVIVAAKSVSSSTAHLLTAAMIKTDAQSASQKRLQAAGKAVTNATTQLVKASVESQTTMEDMEWSDSTLGSATASKVMEMEAQMSILKMEKELDRARNKLATVRKGKYERGNAMPDRRSVMPDVAKKGGVGKNASGGGSAAM